MSCCSVRVLNALSSHAHTEASAQIAQLTRQLEAEHSEKAGLAADKRQLREELDTANMRIDQLEEALKNKNKELQAKEKTLRNNNEELQAKEKTLRNKNEELQAKEKTLRNKNEELQAKEACLEEAAKKEAELAAKLCELERSVESRDKEVMCALCVFMYVLHLMR